ncbi:LysR family transcriptional regulator [Mitsuaria sp. GD03876]|uniref:LysR family transcriptional regulator n=1 Tax=Mitsuaria sp. GD03876 TaxID=2975399 RepID=UPI002448B7BA|nr:LysR family transcriptional regulator [Mitsuaria sp. GD03876]MDH0863173.1 LysR family transcriptional regulator [Mitsuaria sp. GD03876]
MRRIAWQFLPTFVCVAESGSLRQAAQSLHLSHSAVSQQIAELERGLGFPLFDRQAGRLVLNAAGEIMLRSARDALIRVDEAARIAEETMSRTTPVLRLTMPVAFAQRWFLPRLSSWYREHPDISIDVDASPAVRDLERSGIDAAIRAVEVTDPALAKLPLQPAPSRLLAVATPAIAQRLRPLGPAALSGEPLIGDRDEWTRWFAAAGIAEAASPRAGFNSLSLRLDAAERGLGIALARDVLVADAFRAGTLQSVVDLDLPGDTVAPYQLVWRRSSACADVMPLLGEWLARELEASSMEEGL